MGSRQRKFLVVVDKSPEHRVALRYAARRAQHTRGQVSLLTVLVPHDAQQWKSVQHLLMEEAHEEAERMLYDAASYVQELTSLFPELLVREGNTREALLSLLKEDPAISVLVLGAGTAREGPGPLVAAVAGDASRSYPIPVTIVPGRLSDQDIDALA